MVGEGGAPSAGLLAGFAVDLARAIVPRAVDEFEGKVLWLLDESHGLALVRNWLACPEAKRYRDRVKLFGAFRNEDRTEVQTSASRFLGKTFNSFENVRGERCKLLIVGANDLGTGITFTEVRHVILDLRANFFHVVQQMGRATRLCKHSRLRETERSVCFHLPVPVLTAGWTRTRPQPRALYATFTLKNFVEYLKVRERDAAFFAELHVPPPAMESLHELMRSRLHFRRGMRVFRDVGMDRLFFKNQGWGTADEEAEAGALSNAEVSLFVRQRIKAAVEEQGENSDERCRMPSSFLGRGLRDALETSVHNQAQNMEVVRTHNQSSAATRLTVEKQQFVDAYVKMNKPKKKN